MKKLFFLAAVAIMMASCANKDKALKLYNPSADNAVIAVSAVCDDKTEGDDMVIYKMNNISSAVIDFDMVALYKKSYTFTQTGKEYVVLSATGYDSLEVEFLSPFDEDEYRKGGKAFDAPYNIVLWGKEKKVKIEVCR